jgi:hypothetical protein
VPRIRGGQKTKVPSDKIKKNNKKIEIWAVYNGLRISGLKNSIWTGLV